MMILNKLLKNCPRFGCKTSKTHDVRSSLLFFTIFLPIICLRLGILTWAGWAVANTMGLGRLREIWLGVLVFFIHFNDL